MINSLRLYSLLDRRSRRRQRRRRVRDVDRDDTPTGHRASSSEVERASGRQLLNKVLESAEEVVGDPPVISCNTSSSGIVEPDDITSKTTTTTTTTNDTGINLPRELHDASDVRISSYYASVISFGFSLVINEKVFVLANRMYLFE